ncbi:MAG: hypothetical protein HGA44_12050 [Cellulomonadaceae bacterium]|nr:hypothetical protein [Cellulomonadaceae bacterium]
MSTAIPGSAWLVGVLVAAAFVMVPTRRFWLKFLGRKQAVSTKNAEFLLGADDRYSTGKLTAYSWTSALASGAAVLLTGVLVGDVTLESIGMNSIPETYLVLIAVPYGGLVGAKLITATKVEQQTVQRLPGGPNESAAGFIGDANGRTSLVDIQYLVFNGLLLVYFVVALAVQGAVPELPEWLVGLTGTGGAVYLAQKAIERNPPEITALSEFGNSVRVRGRNFIFDGEPKPENAGLAGYVVKGVARVGAKGCTWGLTIETDRKVERPYTVVLTTGAGATVERTAEKFTAAVGEQP